MLVGERCVRCLQDMQCTRAEKKGDPEKTKKYMEQVNRILEERKDTDSAPFLVNAFDSVYVSMFGPDDSYAPIKKEYNDFVLAMEKDLQRKLEENCDTDKRLLEKAIVYARIGNYIDFAAMEKVDKAEFLTLFDDDCLSEPDRVVFERFYAECSGAKRFLLIADNCGEIVMDKLFIRALRKCFPDLSVTVMVRGREVLNDATMEDAVYAGMQEIADVVSNGTAVAGTIYEMLSGEAKQAMDSADIILSKGQGNFETLSGQGFHIYYAFLCKCEVFTRRFAVPKLTGMFVADL